MTDLKIERGKFYRTRDGRKAECVYIFDSGVRLIVVIGTGIVFNTIDGSLFGDIKDQLDLISEWKEPLKIECKVKWESTYAEGSYESNIIYPAILDNGKFYGEYDKNIIGKTGTLTFVEDV